VKKQFFKITDPVDIEKNQEPPNTGLNMDKVATRVGQAFNFFNN
jgi:hypothetical protein